MSITNQKEQDPKKSLLVTIELTKTKLKYFQWLLAAIIEHSGCHLEDKVKTEKLHKLTVFFERRADGEQFFNMISNTSIKITKEEN